MTHSGRSTKHGSRHAPRGVASRAALLLTALTPGPVGAGAPPPLASCRVETVAPAAAAERFAAGLSVAASPTLDPLDDYQPLRGAPAAGRAGEGATRVRLLLTGPRTPLLLDVMVRVAGTPFHEARGAWIDGVLRGADDAPQATAEKPTTQGSAPGAADAAPTTAAADNGERPAAGAAPAGVRPRVRVEPTLRERLRHYVAAVGAGVEPEEVALLLDRWRTGHDLLVLSPGRSWQRANSAPLYTALDADRDGTLAAGEIEGAARRLASLDRDEDAVVDADELARGGVGPQALPPHGPLLVVVDPRTEWGSVVLPDGPMTRERWAGLATAPPDAVFWVDFTGAAGAELTLRSTAGALAGAPVASAGAIEFADHLQPVQVSAADSPAAGEGDAPPQLSVGAVAEGAPLLRVVDADADGRITQREAARLAPLLRSLDADADGGVSPSELPAPVRVVVARGAVAHAVLAAPAPPVGGGDTRPSAGAPDWFLSMDTNRDGDLSQSEFVGAADQFRLLDANGDGAVSVAEARAIEPP